MSRRRRGRGGKYGISGSLLAVIILLALVSPDFGKTDKNATSTPSESSVETTIGTTADSQGNGTGTTAALSSKEAEDEASVDEPGNDEEAPENDSAKQNSASFSYDQVPEYTGEPSVEVNGNVPFFLLDEITNESFESYAPLDSLGRCGAAFASLSQDTMPTEERGSIGSVKPTGWHTVKYSNVDGHYLYNRCHLIAYALSAENANKQNLITGTRYMNVDGMLPYETETVTFIKSTGFHVMYRATPVFVGDELLARGVLLEARSVEDGGMGLQFCVFCYNVQPGVTIDYTDGSSSGPEYSGS